MKESYSPDFDPDNPFEPEGHTHNVLENLPDDIDYDKGVFGEFEIFDPLSESVFENEGLDKIVRDYYTSKRSYAELSIKINKKDL